MKFDTIEDMETFAKGEEDHSANVKIRGQYLEVTAVKSNFTYRWGKNLVSREVAERVFNSR